MERPALDMSSLFAQLGIPNDERAIARFIEHYGPLDSGVRLHEAAFWNPAQAAFLCEAILLDAEWAEVVDALNSQLHARH